ncbi:MAG: metal-dependent hydrolase, partial [Beggiatoa sp. IS2]
NSSSSLFQSKMTGNLVFMLLAPLSSLEIYLAFVGAAVIRGLLVGSCVWLAATGFVVLPVYHLGVLLGFAILGSAMLGALGLIAGLWAEKWDHIAVFQNFIILPLSFLSGTFYRINTLPDFWQHLSYYNPFLYMIEGFRYGFIGIADIPIGMSLIVSGISLVIISVVCLWLLHSGFKIRG